ncbi:MAG: hypothetical protein ABJA87_05025 [bacterium]
MSTDMDTRLRQYAQRWREGQSESPAVPEFAAARDAAPRRARRARRTTVVAMAASIASVGLIAASTLVLDRGEHGGAPLGSSASARPRVDNARVPWNRPPLRPYPVAVPAAPTVAAPAGLRHCANADLRIESTNTTAPAGAEGWLETDFVLRSVATSPCSVPNGFLNVELVSADGSPLPQDAIPVGGAVFPSALLVRPAQIVLGTAQWAVYEGRAPRPARLVINPDGGAGHPSDGLSVSVAAVAIPAHPRNPSNVGPWRATSYGTVDRVADPGTTASLTASVAAPATVAVGATLRYSVTLTNPTSTAVPLSPCPDFGQRLDVVPVKYATTVGSRGTLNCAQAPTTIGAGESVTFAYELDTTGEVDGPGALNWSLLDGSTAAVTARTDLTVTR